MLTMCLKEKKWEWTGDMYPYFMKRQMSNMESVVVCPEILFDASRHDKEKNEAHNRRYRYSFMDLWRKEGDI